MFDPFFTLFLVHSLNRVSIDISSKMSYILFMLNKADAFQTQIKIQLVDKVFSLFELTKVHISCRIKTPECA